jgi:hypothetical protein
MQPVQLDRPEAITYPGAMATDTRGNPLKYADGHTEHTDDCMSDWSEARRHSMTPQTIACNHRLHLADYFAYVCTLADCGWASNDQIAVCPKHGIRVATHHDRQD